MMKKRIADYSRLVKFSHTLFALPFALIGFFMAVSHPDVDLNWKLLGLVLVCMVTARNAAMSFNRYLDHRIDAKNPRTQNREIPAGIISPKQALIFVVLNAVLFVATTWFINILCFELSPVALTVILGYSYMKRISPLCHFVLSAGLALAPIGAFLAVTGKFSFPPLIVSFIVFFWVSGFDIIYSSQDVKFDKNEGLRSVPVLMGVKNALYFSSLLHVLTAIFILYLGIILPIHWIYWIGAGLFLGLLNYQHMIVKPNDLSRVNLAFGTTNGIASLLYACFTIPAFYL